MECKFRVSVAGAIIDEEVRLKELGSFLVQNPTVIEVIGRDVRMLAYNDMDKRRMTFQFRAADDVQADEDFFNSL